MRGFRGGTIASGVVRGMVNRVICGVGGGVAVGGRLVGGLKRVLPSVMAAVVLSFLAASLPWPGTAQAAGEADATALLRQADRSRGNLEGVSWEVAITSEENGRTSQRTLSIKSRGYDFLAEFLSPPKYKGEKLLMVSGNMWFSKPGLSKPAPISRRQRLMGQAANGDIAATNYAEEYDPSPAGEETVDGEACRVFELRAREKKSTYDRIRYWISRDRGVGIRAEYYTVSGKLIKTALIEYQHTMRAPEGTRPFISRMVISDAIVSANTTTLLFGQPAFGKIPDHVFNLNLLNR